MIGEVLVAGEFISQSDLDRALAEQRKTNERLGEILIRLGIISLMELKAVLAFQSDIELSPAQQGAAIRHKLGDLLVKGRKLQRHELDSALAEQEKTNEKLGEVLLRLGLVSDFELDAVLAWQHEHTYNSAKSVRFMLGEILVATHVITRDQLTSALRDQSMTKRQIGDILVEAGLAKPNHITEALKIQGKLIAASLVAIIGAAALTGCGTGASLTGISVDGGSTATVKTSSGVASRMAVDNVRGAMHEYKGGAQTNRTTLGVHGVSDYEDGSKVIDNVPWFHQGAAVSGSTDPDNTCAQAASSMVLRYWQGDKAPSYQQVVDEANHFNLATSNKTLTDYLTHKGMKVNAYKNGTINYLKSAVDAGHPVIALLQFDVPHYIVVTGYNDEQGKIIYHDSIDGPNQQLDEDEFKSHWHKSDMKDIPIIGGANYVGLAVEATL